MAFVSDAPRPPSACKARLAGIEGLGHVTVEVEPCPDFDAGWGKYGVN